MTGAAFSLNGEGHPGGLAAFGVPETQVRLTDRVESVA
jgi:hypothetical protein